MPNLIHELAKTDSHAPVSVPMIHDRRDNRDAVKKFAISSVASQRNMSSRHAIKALALLMFCFMPLAGEIPVKGLRFTEQDTTGSVGGAAMTVDGIVSTRRGNAGSWMSMVGKSPSGSWELSLPNTDEIKNRFKNDEILDILFVITYSGQTPSWPA